MMKITVFVMDMKYAVKLEAGMMEQTYKLRQSEIINSLEDIAGILDASFLEACLQRFESMHTDLSAALIRANG